VEVVGTYDTKEEAARAYDAAARERAGEEGNWKMLHLNYASTELADQAATQARANLNYASTELAHGSSRAM
jgi:hypothetical protein